MQIKMLSCRLFVTLGALLCIAVGTNGQEFMENPSFDKEFQTWRHGFFNNGGVALFPLFRKVVVPASRRADSSEEITSDDRDREPLEIDSISGSIGDGPDDTRVEVESAEQPGSSIFPIDIGQSINPFFINPFLNGFSGGFGGSFGNDFAGGFAGGFNRPRLVPWWKKENVCTEREEDLGEPDTYAGFHFGVQINSCIERSNKHVCTTISNEHGRKKTSSVTHQCCHGFRRSPNADIQTPCEKFDLQSVMDTAEKKLGAKEFISSARRNGLDKLLTENVTVFLPNDTAFTEFAEQMFESNMVLIPNARIERAAENDESGVTTKDLVLNHVVRDWIDIEDIDNEQILVSEYKNTTIRMNVFPSPPNDDSFESRYRYTANCVPITKSNQAAENGIVHVIERVMLPVTKNLMELIRERSDMAVLRTVLEKTDLAAQLEKQTKHFTMFAPTDAAFEKLSPQLRRIIKNGNGCAMNILKNHILEMTFCSVAVVPSARTNVVNSLGQKLNLERVLVNKTEESENEIADLIGNDDVPIIQVNGLSSVTETDIMATNGVMHVVDTVLETESGMPFSSILDTHNLSVLKALIVAGNFEDELDAMDNVTLFAPTDKAFNGTHWKQVLSDNPESLKDNEELKTFLKYHIVKPQTKTCDLEETMIKTESGEPLRLNLYSTQSLFTNVMNRATVNCARLVHFDDESCGSVLHQIDHVLEAPKENLLEALNSNKNYNMFSELLRVGNLTHLLDNANNSYTVLVPSDSIFEKFSDMYDGMLKNPRYLEHFVKLHILDEVLCCAGIVHSEWPIVRLVKTLNKFELRITRNHLPTIQSAGITKCDIVAKNGIILEVNDVVNVYN